MTCARQRQLLPQRGEISPARRVNERLFANDQLPARFDGFPEPHESYVGPVPYPSEVMESAL